MYRTLIQLSDGTEISSGLSESIYIKNSKIRESVNAGYELTLGSVCATEATLTVVTDIPSIRVAQGTEFTLFKVSDSGDRTCIGLFTAEQPTRVSSNSYSVTAYDRVIRLEKDLTSWISELTEWPYSLGTFAAMVCRECGLTLRTTSFLNDDFPVEKFQVAGVTGRRIMEWVGQLAARFVRATTEGDIELAWYQSTDLTFTPSGDLYYYSGSLQYEDYEVAPIDAVQVRLADSDAGLLWPAVPSNYNVYILRGNRLLSSITEATRPYIESIGTELGQFTYTPCKVSVPANMQVRAGSIVSIRTRDDRVLSMYVMHRTQSGQRDELECTGSVRRDDASAYDPDPRTTAEDAAEGALKRQSQLDIFNKLTNNGQIEGLFMEQDGQVYINASYISTGVLASKDGKNFYLNLDEGVLEMNASSLQIQGKSISEFTLDGLTQAEIVSKLTEDGAAQGIFLQNGQLYVNASYINSGELNASLITAGVLRSKDGETFVLDLDKGTLRMKGSNRLESADGNSYIALEGNEFVLYAKSDTSESFQDIAHLGYTEDSEGYDYPYLLLGTTKPEDSDYDNTGLIKMFQNGLYIGNSAPRLATGNFLGMSGAAGLFVYTQSPMAAVVTGFELDPLFTGHVDAVFA